VRCHHGGVVHEAKLLHHEELPIPADAQEGHPHAPDLLHANGGKLIDDVRLANHLVEPILNGGVLGPPQFGTTVTKVRE